MQIFGSEVLESRDDEIGARRHEKYAEDRPCRHLPPPRVQTCRAAYLVSLSTTAPDLNNLAVGQKITLDVNLSGISSPADNLDFLAATVKFDGGLLGTPTITPGPIVPDLTGFHRRRRRA